MISLNVCFARPCRVRFGTTAAQGYTSRVWHKSTQTWGLLCANETDTAHRALSALNCNTVISRNVRRGPRAFPRGGCREGGNAGVAAFLLAAYHYRFTFIHGEQRPHVYVRVYVRIYVSVRVSARCTCCTSLFTRTGSPRLLHGTVRIKRASRSRVSPWRGSLKHIHIISHAAPCVRQYSAPIRD